MKNAIYIVPFLFSILVSSCYKDSCTYSPNRLTYINSSINIVDNYGKTPVNFDGNSLSSRTYGIFYRLNFLENIDPDNCNWLPQNAPRKVLIFTVNNFNSTYPSNSNITSAFTLLRDFKSTPSPLTSNVLGKYNYFLLNEKPAIDTIQQFRIVSFNYYNDTVSVDTIRAITITK